MSLLQLQRDMRAWLVREDPDAAKRYGSDAAPGLRVYQNNYRAQLVACLEESFAQTRAWIGGEAFHEAVVAHIERIPPSSWTLDAYPRDFPATLAMLYPDDPEIAELAWIDCALSEAFVGPDHATLGIDAIATIDWDRAILDFTPTLDIAQATTNAAAIWSALSAGEVSPPAHDLSELSATMVWRSDQISCFRSLDQDEYRALVLARSGTPFAPLCQALVDVHGDEAGVTLAGSYLGRWLNEGLVRGVSQSG